MLVLRKDDRFDIQLLYVSGDKSAVGKTSTCICILDTLITVHGYRPQQLAYMKPCSQCVDVQLIWKYCHQKDIVFRGLGPVLFYAGFTEQCLLHGADPQSEFYPETLRASIVTAVNEMIDRLIERNVADACGLLDDVQKEKRRKLLIVIDGVGHPGVSALCGVSNGQVAQCLGVPVVQVVRPCDRYSLGATLDSFEFNRRFMESYSGVRVIGVIFNKMKLPSQDGEMEKADKYARLRRLIGTYFDTRKHSRVHLYGIVDETQLENIPDTDNKSICVAPRNATSDSFNKTRFEVTQEDVRTIEQLVTNFRRHIPRLDGMLTDLATFFAK